MKTVKFIVGVLVAFGATVSAGDLSGRWTINWDPDFSGNWTDVDCTFKQDGARLTVDCDGAPFGGEVQGQMVTLQLKTGRDGGVTATLKGELDQAATTLTGTWHLEPDNRDGKFEAKKR